uniref:Uncharacterized protein n=1 Tax=Romanomermis culicivorax TaxID=13658 RepID=A0A915J446_ROMCU
MFDYFDFEECIWLHEAQPIVDERMINLQRMELNFYYSSCARLDDFDKGHPENEKLQRNSLENEGEMPNFTIANFF